MIVIYECKGGGVLLIFYSLWCRNLEFYFVIMYLVSEWNFGDNRDCKINNMNSGWLYFNFIIFIL